MELLNDNILVTELQDDLFVNGTAVVYDQDSPYMFCAVLGLSDDAKQYFTNDDILVIKRYAKEEYLPGQYFISLKDVRGKMSKETYSKMCQLD